MKQSRSNVVKQEAPDVRARQLRNIAEAYSECLGSVTVRMLKAAAFELETLGRYPTETPDPNEADVEAVTNARGVDRERGGWQGEDLKDIIRASWKRLIERGR